MHRISKTMKSQAMDRVDEHEPEISRLPEGCVAHVLSLMSPQDSFASASVSSTFRSAVDSDAVWERFLPPDYREILSRAVDEVVFSSKKDLFARLCRPVLIDGGKKSFVLEKSTGKKCYMLSARELYITWGDTPKYWNWTSLPESRFSEVAELLNVCWLEITGKLKTAELSPKTTYIAYFIFKLSHRSHGIEFTFQEASVSVGEQVSKEIVSLTTRECRSRTGGYGRRVFVNSHNFLLYPPPRQAPQLHPEAVKHVAHARSDGWIEVAMGEFFNKDGDDGEVAMSLFEVRGGHWKSGLIVEGIELRPKK